MCAGPNAVYALLNNCTHNTTPANDNVVYIRPRNDGKVFNLARLRARTETRTKLTAELLLTYDTALIAHEPAKMQQTVNVFPETTKKLGLQINIGKIEVMYQPSPLNPDPQWTSNKDRRWAIRGGSKFQVPL